MQFDLEILKYLDNLNFLPNLVKKLTVLYKLDIYFGNIKEYNKSKIFNILTNILENMRSVKIFKLSLINSIKNM